jgi:GNAT superfamily N-acetyltransferase
MQPTSQSLSVKLRELTGERLEVQAVQELIEAAPDYMYRITGLPPGSADGQSTFLSLPEDKSYEDKFVYGIYWGEQMVGCADVIRAYPKKESAWIGLLLIAEPYQRRGIGAIAYELLENQIRAWPGIQSICLSVIRTNDHVLPFWKKKWALWKQV